MQICLLDGENPSPSFNKLECQDPNFLSYFTVPQLEILKAKASVSPNRKAAINLCEIETPQEGKQNKTTSHLNLLL